MHTFTFSRQSCALETPKHAHYPAPAYFLTHFSRRMTTLGPVLQPMETCFKVFPEKADILPHNSTTFKVAFRPVYDNAYYSQSLEVFMYPKTQRNFRLVITIPPPCAPPIHHFLSLSQTSSRLFVFE